MKVNGVEYNRYIVYLIDHNRNGKIYTYLSNVSYKKAIYIANKSPYMHVGVDFKNGEVEK